MEDKRDTEKQIRGMTRLHIDIANGYLREFKESIEKCNIVNAVPTFKEIHVNVGEARNYAHKLPADQREDLLKEILSIESESTKITVDIPKKCECKTKEPFRYVKESPEE